MNLRRILPIAMLALVAVIAVVALWGKRPPQRDEAASIQGSVSTPDARNTSDGRDPATQVASVRQQGTTARSRGIYRRTATPATRVASVKKSGSARSRGVYRGNAAAATHTASPRQGGMKIPGTSIGLWPES